MGCLCTKPRRREDNNCSLTDARDFQNPNLSVARTSAQCAGMRGDTGDLNLLEETGVKLNVTNESEFVGTNHEVKEAPTHLKLAKKESIDGISDICGLKNTKFIIQSGVRYVELRSLNQNMSVDIVRPLLDNCKRGDHYLARYDERRVGGSFTRSSLRKIKDVYIIKGKSCMRVDSLDAELGKVRDIFDLHPECQGGSHYLANRAGFFIIHREDNSYLQATDMSKDGYDPILASRHKLHEFFVDGMYYFATDDYFYILKENTEFGLVYHRTKDLRTKEEEAVLPVSPSVVNFLRSYSCGGHLQNGNYEAHELSTPRSSSPIHVHPTSEVTSSIFQPTLVSTKPSSYNLTVIKWRGKRGEVNTFRLKSSIIHKWRMIGDLVEVPRQTLATWANRRSDEESCDAVLDYWLDNPPHNYPTTWQGLYELLEDSELSQVASNLEQAVNNAIS